MRTKLWVLSALVITLMLGIYGLASNATIAGAATPPPSPTAGMSMGGGMDSKYSANDLVPLAKAYYAGDEVYFIHPEASDPGVAEVLTKMMGPKVFAVPALAKVPAELLGNVYVFTNGVTGMGPLGFQPDVFDTVPGDEKYTPLRAISLVTWKDTGAAKELKSVAEIQAAETAKQLEIQRPGVVVNMPILVWPGGKR